MSIHGNVSAIWKDITYPSANVSGTWEDGESAIDGVMAAYVNVSGVWKIAWPLEISLAILHNDNNIGGSGNAQLDIQEDGRVKKSGDNVATTYTNWAENGGDTDKTGAAPTLFEYKWESDGVDPDTAPPVSTWADITGTGPQFITSAIFVDKTATFDLYIRAKDAPTSILVIPVILRVLVVDE